MTDLMTDLMAVYDLLKHPPIPSHLFCGHSLFQRLKDACEPAEGRPINSIIGIRIKVVGDPQERKVEALTMAATIGLPVLFEDDDGNILQVSMPKPEFSPFQFQARGAPE